jgi:hypothetical protein
MSETTSAAQGDQTEEVRNRTWRDEQATGAGPRGFGVITRDRRDVEERIASLFEGDPDRLEQINDLLDELDELRREFGRRTAKKTRDEERYRAERTALGAFTRRTPSKALTVAEANLKKALAAVVPKKVSLDEVDEALFQVQVANGFANARYVLTTAPFADFRDQVADYVALRAATNGSPEAQRALESAAEEVRRMMPLPPAPVEDEVIEEWDDPDDDSDEDEVD